MSKKIRVMMPVIILAVIFTVSGMMGQIAPALIKPSDRGFNGMEGFVDDYVGYVSYVKEGLYGANFFSIRSIPPPQPASTVHLLYVWTGKIAGIFGLSAPTGYHLMRFFSGVLLFMLMFILFRRLIVNRKLSIIAALLATLSNSVGWYIRQDNMWVYQTLSKFGFTDNVALRFASRPHYLIGASLFIILTLINLDDSSHVNRFRIIMTLIIGCILGTVHPSFALLLTVISGLMIIWRTIRYRNLSGFTTTYFSTITGMIFGMGLSYYFTHLYPVVWILSFEEYVVTQQLEWNTIIGDMIAFGPVFWLGITGLVFVLLKNKAREEKQVYVAIWLMVQIMFFFWLYRFFRSERVRYIQSLYFIPMAYGTVILLQDLSKRFLRWILRIFIIILFFLLLPAYYHDFLVGLYSNTNFKSYSYFVFPTRAMMDGYKWLDRNTPPESTVIASYEAANNIIIYSHNYVFGNKEGWPYQEGILMESQKDGFFLGLWDETTTRKFLTDNRIRYVYKGYQEADGFLKDPYYEEIYRNPEVTIYKVKSD